MRTLAWLIGATVAIGGVHACGGEGQPLAPAGGVLRATLTTPGRTTGAVLIQVSGGSVDSVTAAGYLTYAARFGSDSTLFIVVGNVRNGVIARLHVPDAGAAASYQATVRQAAERNTFNLLSPADYSVTLGK